MKTLSGHLIVLTLAVGALLTGCATRQTGSAALWSPPDEMWQRAAQTGVRLNNSKTGASRFLSAVSVRNLYEVKKTIASVSGVHTNLAVVDAVEPNAFAFERDGRQYIAVSIPLLEAVGADRDALATTLGHELAHVKLGHRAARTDRAHVAQGTSQVLGTLLGIAGVPFGGTIASVGVSAVSNAFSRDEERAADEIGLQWAVTAGFDPCGAYRTIEALQRANDGQTAIPFLSTHPSYAERTAFANELAIKHKGHACAD
jgi:predicted Zn-dependent protease